MGHVICFDFNNNNINLIFELIYSFHMPLFMFLAGFVGLKMNQKFDFKITIKYIINKFITLIIPFLSVGLLFTYYYRKELTDLFFHPMKLGYWFTWVLFFIGCINLIPTFISEKLNKNKALWIDLLIYGVICMCFEIINKISFFPKSWELFLSWDQIIGYYRYFALGFIIRKYDILLKLITESNLIFTVSLFLFCGSLIYNRYYSFNRLTYLVVGISAIFTCVYLFKKNTDIYFGKCFEYLGQKSLDIYLIHYFFIFAISIPKLGDFFANGENFVFQLFLTSGISILVIALTLFVSKIIRTSNLLSILLLGKI